MEAGFGSVMKSLFFMNKEDADGGEHDYIWRDFG